RSSLDCFSWSIKGESDFSEGIIFLSYKLFNFLNKFFNAIRKTIYKTILEQIKTVLIVFG
ncbi:MAG TPA: hypothetical protein VGA94_04590, partial [Thermodesulfobacteriota bacterium]